jgi:hypothetical protein
LILLAFAFPVAVYLLALGAVNRRRQPVLVSGVWDFIGLLAAASGFLLLGGPAAITSASERWRTYWLLGQSSGSAGDGTFWALLSLLYFVVVVVGAAFLFWHQRHLTAVYNIAPEALEYALEQTFERMGLRPVKTGSLYVFGMPLRKSRPQRGVEGIQAPHHRSAAAEASKETREDVRAISPERKATPADDLAAETAVLDVHPFARMWHATLRWDPAGGNLRREVEAELRRVLAEIDTPDHELSSWLTLTGFTLLALTLLGLILLLLLNMGGR